MQKYESVAIEERQSNTACVQSAICTLYTPIGIAFDNSEKADLLLLENNLIPKYVYWIAKAQNQHKKPILESEANIKFTCKYIWLQFIFC